jgi:hypothetical protein
MSKFESQSQQAGNWHELFVKMTPRTEGMTQEEIEIEKEFRATLWQKIWIGSALMGNEEAKRMLAQGPPS